MKPLERIGEGIFDLDQEIGRGGEATVWKALEVDEPKRLVAVKLVIYPEKAYLERKQSIDDLFAREARTWAEFQRSPYVVQLYRTFNHQLRVSGGLQYAFGFMMEYSPDGDLRRAIRDGRLAHLDKSSLVALLVDIAKGLKEGHDKDIIHRDVKATNVLLFKGIPNRLCPKLMDFGLSITTSTLDGRLVGTPEYMAPELFDDPTLTPKESDIYSLGVVFYEVMLGRLPFHFNVVDKQERLAKYKGAHQSQEIKFDDVRKKYGKDLATLLQRMLAKSANDRLPLNRVIAQLEKFQVTEMVESLKSTPESMRQREGRYVWHPQLHCALGEVLSYFVISGTSYRGDPTWFMNNLKERGFRGFSIYTILGGYDYILRIWYPRDAQDELEAILRDFRDFHNGNFLRFNVREVDFLRGRSPKPIELRGDPITEVIKCFSEKESEEFRNLKENGFVIGNILEGNSHAKRLRFFITVNAGSRTDRFLIKAYANEFAKCLHESKDAESVSIYEGEGDFQLLVKFCLRKFEHFGGVFERFLTTKAIVQRSDSIISSRTFVEFGEKNVRESDDGNIIAEIGRAS